MMRLVNRLHYDVCKAQARPPNDKPFCDNAKANNQIIVLWVAPAGIAVPSLAAFSQYCLARQNANMYGCGVQEWLWCETWCGNATKPSAKTIDLCNNPLTKEPKLAQARRIVPEWTALDEEVRRYTQQVEKYSSTRFANTLMILPNLVVCQIAFYGTRRSSGTCNRYARS